MKYIRLFCFTFSVIYSSCCILHYFRVLRGILNHFYAGYQCILVKTDFGSLRKLDILTLLTVHTFLPIKIIWFILIHLLMINNVNWFNIVIWRFAHKSFIATACEQLLFCAIYSSTVLKTPCHVSVYYDRGNHLHQMATENKLTAVNSLLFVCVNVLMVKTAWLDSILWVLSKYYTDQRFVCSLWKDGASLTQWKNGNMKPK